MCTLPGGRQLGVWAGEGLGLKGCCGDMRFLLLQPVCSTDSVPCTLLPRPSINFGTPPLPRMPQIACHTQLCLPDSHTSTLCTRTLQGAC